MDLAESGDGRWDVNITAVQCPVGSSKIKYLFQGSYSTYLKLRVSNYRYVVVVVSVPLISVA